MKRLIVLVLSCVVSSTVYADKIVGYWAQGTTLLHVEIVADELVTKVVTISDPLYAEGESQQWPAGSPRRDDNNPDESLRDRPIVGMVLARASRGKNGKWEGKLYDPESGKTYSSNIWVEDNGMLKMRGYIGFSLLGRTVEWTSASECSAAIVALLDKANVDLCSS